MGNGVGSSFPTTRTPIPPQLTCSPCEMDEAPLRARVVRRQGDRVSVQIQLSDRSTAVA